MFHWWKQEKLTTRVGVLEAENSQQDEEIVHLRSKIFNLESLPPSKFISNDAINQSSYYKNDGSDPSTRVLSGPPTSCQELKDNNGLVPTDGIHLLKNKGTGKIEASFCMFPSSANPIPNGRTNSKYYLIR